MTKISKVSDHDIITSVFEQVARVAENGSHPEMPTQPWPAALDENGLTDEMDKIEKCASSGGTYVYNLDWPEAQISQLKEYATICGLNKMAGGRQEKQQETSDVPANDNMIKQLADISATAKPQVSADLAIAVGDPFKLTDLKDSPKEASDWQKVAPESKMASSPDINSRSGSVLPIRGEFQYERQPTLRVRRGENSLANPDAIEMLTKEEDTGERLKSESKARETQLQASKKLWQKEAVETAKNIGAGALPRGTVFMTGSIPEPEKQSGLDVKQAAEELTKMQAPTLPEVPDITDGEKLHKANEERKAAIQREAKKDEWQAVKGTTRPSLSDAFSDALEFQLKKIVDTKK